MKITLCLCVSVIKLTQRHKDSEAQRDESLTFLTGLTGLTRLGNESLLCDKIILTQRGKDAERQRRMKKTLCLCVSVIKLTQRHKGSEAQRGDEAVGVLI